MADQSFFSSPRDQSAVKSRIVSKYFAAWASVIMQTAKRRSGKVGYIDLFCGPGRYHDGSKSTPLLIMEHVVQHPELSKMLVTFFNDSDQECVAKLKEEVGAITNIDCLHHAPVFSNEEVSEETVHQLDQIELIPSLLFADPFGYKGLSLALLRSVLKNWLCDCIFFFNYNRINHDLHNLAVQNHMEGLFGKSPLEMRRALKSLPPVDREMAILAELHLALQTLGGKYVLTFRFRNRRGTRTSHYLVFVCKHPRGYHIMKEIMARESSTHQQGVPSFEYNPAGPRYPLLHELDRPLETLANDLLARFAGQSLTMRDVYEQHSVGTPFIAANYKQVLAQLETQGKVSAIPPKSNRSRGFGDKVIVIFPHMKDGHNGCQFLN